MRFHRIFLYSYGARDSLVVVKSFGFSDNDDIFFIVLPSVS